MTEHAGSDKAMVFTTTDCSDGDIRPIMVNMCVKFGSPEKALLFQEEFEKAMVVMKELEAGAYTRPLSSSTRALCMG